VGGLPSVLSGEVMDRAQIAPMDAAFFRRDYDIDVRTGVDVGRLDPTRHQVHTSAGVLHYDSLIYALGAGTMTPSVFATEAVNVSPLRSPAHLQKILKILEGGARRVAVVGGGYYGVEAAECLARRGVHVTLVERGAQLLAEFSPSAAARAALALAEQGVEVRLGVTVDQVFQEGDRVTGLELNGQVLDVDLVVLTTGVRPRTEIFAAAGGVVLADGSIPVDERCATNLADVYATSICVSHPHAVTGHHVWTAQASDADKTAQVAGQNAAGGDARLVPTLGTAIVRAGLLHLARTGHTQVGGHLEVVRTLVSGSSCDPFFPERAPLDVALYSTRQSERIVGAEVVGHGGVDKRIDVLATAVLAKLDLRRLGQLDLAYSPPYATARDILHVAALVGQQAKRVRTWEPADFAARPASAVVVDVRSEAERAASPWAALPLSLSEIRQDPAGLDNNATVVFVCETGRSSYLAACAAVQRGCHGAGYVSGGLRALRALAVEQHARQTA
jgi:NADPH-dependent 2,4-dienoyl-CoA reductase/sulfur reductase-like enzyme/rhodanese-related sulfurtransferase